MSSHSNGVRVLHRAADASNLGRCDSGKNVGNKSPIIACSDLAGMASIIPSSIPSFHPIRLISTMKNQLSTLSTISAPGGRNSREQLQPATAAPGTLSDDALMGAQLTEQFKKAITATRDVVIFGAMMLKVRESVSACGHANLGNEARRDTGLKAWLDLNAPDVARSRPTAYRFMALAEGVQEEFNVGKKCDLTLLLTAPDDELTPALRNKQRSILDFLEGKSQRQLLLQLGGDEKKAKSPRKKDEDLTPEQEFELVTGALKKDAIELFSTLETYAHKKHFQVLNDAELDAAISMLDAARASMEAWRKTPKGKRLADAVQNEIRLWKGVK